MKGTAILDLDNCIADDGWRIKFIDWEAEDKFLRYDKYHKLSGLDECCNKELFSNPNIEIVIFTGRPNHYRKVTEDWLRANEVGHELLLMRDDDDYCSSVELKTKQLNKLIHENGYKFSNIAIAYDDRQDVVEMYNSFGILSVVKRIHNICSYTDPNDGVDRG